jgi:hypothetical protein
VLHSGRRVQQDAARPGAAPVGGPGRGAARCSTGCRCSSAGLHRGPLRKAGPACAWAPAQAHKDRLRCATDPRCACARRGAERMRMRCGPDARPGSGPGPPARRCAGPGQGAGGPAHALTCGGKFDGTKLTGLAGQNSPGAEENSPALRSAVRGHAQTAAGALRRCGIRRVRCAAALSCGGKFGGAKLTGLAGQNSPAVRDLGVAPV